MADTFRNRTTQLDSPGEDGFAVTPHNTNDLQQSCRSLYVGSGGDVVVTTVGGTDLTFKNVADGGYVLMRCSRVKATGTTASDIVAIV